MGYGGSHYVALGSLELTMKPGLSLESQRPAYLPFLSPGIKGVYLHTGPS